MKTAEEFRLEKGYNDNMFMEPTGYSSVPNMLEIDGFAEAYAKYCLEERFKTIER